MPNMSVKMTMTLDDLASPGVKRFMELIDAIGPKVTGLSQRLGTLENRLSGVGTKAEASATKLGTFDAAVTKSEANAAKLAATLAGIEAAVKTFDTAIASLRGALGSLATSFATITTAADKMGAGMTTAAGGIGAANAALATMQGRVHGLTDSLLGMAEVWASIKLFQAGKSTIDASSEFQQLEARVKSFNLPAGQTEEFIAKSRQMSKDMPYISLNQAMEARLAAVGGLGRNTSEIGDPQINNIIDRVLPQAINAAMVLKRRGDQSELKDIVRNLMGVVEMRGQTSNPEAMIKSFDLVVQALGSTQGKLTTKDLETVMRYLKNATGQMMNDEGIANVVAFANQLRASGTGGGGGGGAGGVSQAGTAVTQVVKWALGGSMNKEAIRMLTAMGELNPAMVRADSSTTTENVAAGAFKHSKEMLENPIGAMTNILGPMFLAFTKANKDLFFAGEDINDPAAQDRAVARLIVKLGGTVNVGNVLAQSVLPGPASRIEQEKNLTFQSKGVTDSMKDLLPTFNMNVEKFKESMNTLEVALGTTLLPMLTKFLDVAAKFVRWLDDVANSNPTTVQITLIAGALASLALMLSGLQRIFGIFTILKEFGTYFGAAAGTLSTGATAIGTAWAGASGVITGALAVIGAAIKRIIPIAAAFLIGWDVGTVVRDLEIGGKSVSEWAVGFMSSLVTTFNNGWIRIKAFMNLITDAEKDRLLAESNAKNQMVKRTGQLGASGSWGDWTDSPVPPKYVPPGHTDTPEEAMRKKNKAFADFLLHEQDLTYRPPNKDANKLFYNPAADAAKQEARIASAQEILDLKLMEKEYANAKISVDDYYDRKIQKMTDSTIAETDAMQKELDALKKPARGKVDQAAVSRVSTDIKLREMKLDEEIGVAEELREKAHADLAKKRIDIDRQSDAISGHRHEAELQRLARLNEAERARFLIEGDTAAVKSIDDARARAVAGGKIGFAYSDLQVQLNAYKDKEKEVTDEVKAGTKTQSEAETEVYNLRKQSALLMDEFIQKYRELAIASGDPKWLKAIDDLTRQTKAGLTELAPEVLKIKGILETGFTGFFENLMNGGMSLRKMFDGLFSSILRGLNQMAAQNISQYLGKMIFGGSAGQSMSAASAASGGGIGGMLGGFFSGGWGAATQGAGMVMPSDASPPILDAIFSFDTGIGRVPYDMLAQIHKDEIIVNANDAKGIRSGEKTLGAGGGKGINATFVLSQPMDPRSQSQVATEAAQKYQEMARRNG